MKLIPTQLLAVFFQRLLLLHTLVNIAQSTLQEMVDAIATYDNATDTIDTSVCIFTTANSSLDTIDPLLLPTLVQKYPTTFMTMQSYVDMEMRRLATLVLLDLTAYHDEFPFAFIQRRLNHHPCYHKTAKFIILLGGASFERKETALRYLEKFSILNFVLIPVANSSGSFTVYTWNQYTAEEHYFRSTDRPVERFFPDKLRNLNGYMFTMHGITQYPYMLFEEKGIAHGLVPKFVNTVIKKRCNGTTYYTEDGKMRSTMDANFNVPNERFTFINTFYFWEETGVFLVCPVRSVRDFLSHLLKPFTLGIWLVLGGLFALCRVAQLLFPRVFRYDLITMTFFGGGGIAYLQPFAFRIVTLTLAVLMFFLSEAYNTKIISLMSLSKFHEQPQTLEEVRQSPLRIMSTRSGTSFFGPISQSFLSFPATLREQRRLGDRVHQHYCAMMFEGDAWIAVSPQIAHIVGLLYIVPERLLIDKVLIQLKQHSPFFELFQRIFGLLNESGLWSYILHNSNVMLFTSSRISSLQAQLREVIFYFDDLICVWILIIVGWLISTVCFASELVWQALRERKRRRVAKKFQTVRHYRLVKAWLSSEN